MEIIQREQTRLGADQRTAGDPGLHQEGEMSFEPGVMVTNGHQVKGLEFTNVVLWDPAGTDYRHTAVDRNLLYVAITRACKRLDIVHWRTLAKGLEAGKSKSR